MEYAWFNAEWEYDKSNIGELRAYHQSITVEEFMPEMEGQVFCPLCFTPLSRSPRDKALFTNGRSAHFRHHPSYREVGCPNRSIRAEGLRFETEEDARRAIENDQLAVIHGFLQDKPEANDAKKEAYDHSAVEDANGPASTLPISRYRGESFSVPSKFTSVRGICREFDRNIEKYFVLPERYNPQRLRDLLISVEKVKATNPTPSLYYGKITAVNEFGGYNGTRMVSLSYPGGEFPDFCFKQSNGSCDEHGVNKDSVGRYLIMYGPIEMNGVGLCVKHVAWGEFAILPKQYQHLLES